MKKIIYADIRRDISTTIAERGTAWVGQIGDDNSNDQTKLHRTARAAALEIARFYNDNLEDFGGEEVRVINIDITDADGHEFGYCNAEIIVRERDGRRF